LQAVTHRLYTQPIAKLSALASRLRQEAPILLPAEHKGHEKSAAADDQVRQRSITPFSGKLLRISVWLGTWTVLTWTPAGAAELPALPITAQERASVIDDSLAQLRELYVFPKTAAAMDAAVRARLAKGEYRSIVSGEELARKLTADLREVSHDEHLRIEYFPKGVPAATQGAPNGNAPNTRGVEPGNSGFTRVEWLDGNVGYVEIRELLSSAEAQTAASAALSFVANSDALIVDLRRNIFGGDPEGIAYVLSYIFDKPTRVNDIQVRVGNRTMESWTLATVPGRRFGERKPVYVLTSHDTFSGAEEFAYDVQALKRAQVIGEATRGAAHMARPVPISAHFVIGVPFAQAVNPVTHRNWDDTGVIPDTAAPAAQALEVAHRLALNGLIAATQDLDRKKWLQSLLSATSATR
jgi:retinol-binding protein 3